MKLKSARRVLDYPVLQIAELGTDDGGIRVLEYLATDDLPEWPDRPIPLPSRDRGRVRHGSTGCGSGHSWRPRRCSCAGWWLSSGTFWRC